MIRINLLPLELRRPERTPLPRRLTIFLGVAATAGLVALGIWQTLQIKLLTGEIADLEKERDEWTRKTADFDAVKAERDNYQKRKEAVDQIQVKRKFRWSQQLDTLADVIDLSPRAWLASIKFGEGSPSGVTVNTGNPPRPVEMYMTMKDSQTSTADKNLYGDLEKLLTERFLDKGEGFNFLVPPPTVVMVKQDKYIEQWSHKFDVSLLGLGKPRPVGPGGPGGS